MRGSEPHVHVFVRGWSTAGARDQSSMASLIVFSSRATRSRHRTSAMIISCRTAIRGRPRKAEVVEPLEVFRPPGLLAGIYPAVPQQERPDFLALAGPVLHRSRSGTHQIAHRFVRLVRCPELRQLARTEQARQFHGNATVRLHPLAGPARDQRRRDHGAVMPECLELPFQAVAGRPGLVAEPQAQVRTIQLAHETTDGGRIRSRRRT